MAEKWRKRVKKLSGSMGLGGKRLTTGIGLRRFARVSLWEQGGIAAKRRDFGPRIIQLSSSQRSPLRGAASSKQSRQLHD